MTATAQIPFCLPVEGSADAKILFFLRQADALCSNSYIICSPCSLLVIDPGAHEEQTSRIRQMLSDELAVKQRPVFFLLTHCHHDHSRSLEFWRRQHDIPVRLLAHEAGAAALISGDSDLTLSYIYSQNFPSLTIDCPIAFTDSSKIALARDVVLSETRDAGSALHIKRRSLSLGGELLLELYQTPGHSPDSLCLRMGQLLFTGDMLYADKPGVSGIPGWSQPQLLETLRFIELLLADGGITACCPGHGQPQDTADVLGVLQRAFKNARHLNRLVRFDDRRLDFLKTCTVALAREAALQLAVLGGRLQLAAHRLEELGEEILARKLVAGIDLDAMETFVMQFQDFAAAHENDSFRAAIPLRGIAMMGRIQGLLAQAGLPQGIGEISARRIELLLQDYINIVAGLDLLDFLEPCTALVLVQRALDTFKQPDLPEADVEALADSPELFGLYLARRLYQLPDISGITVLQPDEPLPEIGTEPERLTQLFTDCIEQIASLSGKAEITFSHDEDFVAVCLESHTAEPCLNSGKISYYGYMMGLLGGTFSHRLIKGAEQACFRIPVLS